jgi:2-deoxy-D-gluconate 3-dehydrogenase
LSILDLFSLEGKTALVTGASKGLGQALALALAEAGACVACMSRTPDAGSTSDQIKALGRDYHAIQIDFETATPADLERAVQQVLSLTGKIDILVNNAGIIMRTPAVDYAESDWDAILQIDLKAVFFLSQAVARVMKQNGGGKIINVASLLSYQGGILVPAYTAAKPLRADPERNQAILSRIPAGRWGKPSDLQGAVVFLASAASNYMNGTVIDVDGGWMAR